MKHPFFVSPTHHKNDISIPPNIRVQQYNLVTQETRIQKEQLGTCKTKNAVYL